VPPSRFQLPLDKVGASYIAQKARAQTLPASNDSESTLLVTPQHVVNLIESRTEEILLLDLRIQTQYTNSHIVSALNLCIPTTLLKRPSFNVQKLADTFKDDEQRAKFENWRNSSYIVVYDGGSSLLKDATICLNTIKKFRGEGYDGTLYIIKGGFNEFSKRFQKYVESDSDGGGDAANGDRPDFAPVIGGCPMPATDKPANPFFGNIRQNMDLIGGVGQIPIKHPSQETNSAQDEYPAWLKDVAADQDQGKKASQRFEAIERREKKRMEDALSGKVSFGTPYHDDKNAVRIAGLEKGNKNRYNNIWPFEHSRVRLQGVPNHGCDYFNASHIKASWSNKRYISTQAPIPATFNDFWNVVWQQDVRVVVMLTAEKEGAQVKAHNYWDQRQYGSIHLDFLSEKRASLEPSRIRKHQKRPAVMQRHSTKSQNPGVPLAQLENGEEKSGSGGEQPYVIVRKFTISHDRYPFAPMREITQLQYSSWPDFGAPAHPAHLLGLVEQCNAVVHATSRLSSGEPEEGNNRPILVHCSAGCGRTGTFCTVDSVIDMLKRQRISKRLREHSPMDTDISRNNEASSGKRKGSSGGFFASQFQNTQDSIDGAWIEREDQDLIEKTVEDFRHQRISMVQSLRQYVLCYESVMEWLVEERQREHEQQGPHNQIRS
jgi:protein-tyrosine phosphatase